MRHRMATKVTAMILTVILSVSLIPDTGIQSRVLAAQAGTDSITESPAERINENDGAGTGQGDTAEPATTEETTPENPETPDPDPEEPAKKELTGIVVSQDAFTYKWGETISFQDLKITAKYSDDTEEEIPVKSEEHEDGYEISSESDKVKYGEPAGTLGHYTFTVTYGEKTAAISVTVLKLVGIEVEKTVKSYSTFDTEETIKWDDMVVKAAYSDTEDGTVATTVLLKEEQMKNCRINGTAIDEFVLDNTEYGEQELTISYTEGEGQYEVTESAKLVITIKDILTALEAAKTKTSYTVKKVEIDDLVVTAVYNNNSSQKRVLKPEEYTTNLDSLNKKTAGKQDLVITYKEDDISKEAKIKITLTVPEVPIVNGARLANVLDFAADPSDVYTDKDAIQDALDVEATEKVPLVVYIPAGTYYIGNPLYIHSNTTIRLDQNAVIIRNSELKPGDGREGVNHNMLKAANSNKVTKEIGGYDNVKNIVIEGGTWNGGEISKATTDSNLINLGHAENVVIRNTVIKNCYGNHLIEFAGVKNAEVYGCYFTGFRKKTGGVESEAIQLDVCYSDWNSAYKADKTVCDTISVHDNTFVDYPVSVGNHHLLNGSHNKNITIANNSISYTTGTGYQGIYLYGCDNSKIENNRISGYENGIKTNGSNNYVISGNTISSCEFGIVSAGSSTGAITSNAISDTLYQGIFAYESTKITSISQNSLKNVGTSGDKPRDGIAVRGSGSVVNSITKNTIDTSKRYGICVDTGAKVPKITSNTISNTKKSGIYIEESQSKVTFKSNKLTSVGTNAIKIVNKQYVKQKYTFAPKVKKLNIKAGSMQITASNLKKVQLKFKKKSYSKNTKKKQYTLTFKPYKKKVTSATVLFTDKYKNVVTKTVKVK